MQPWIQAFAGRVIVVLASAERGVNSNGHVTKGQIRNFENHSNCHFHGNQTLAYILIHESETDHDMTLNRWEKKKCTVRSGIVSLMIQSSSMIHGLLASI